MQKLNRHARKTEEEIAAALKSAGIKFDKSVEREIAYGFHLEASQYKQRRRIDELIERKKYLVNNPELIADYKKIELNKYIPHFRKFILGRIMNANPQLRLSDF